MLFQVFPVDGEVHAAAPLEPVETVCKSHIAVLVMVAEGLPVGGHGEKGGLGGRGQNGIQQHGGEGTSVPERFTEGHLLGDAAVVEKQDHGFSRRERAPVRPKNIDPLSRDAGPGICACGPHGAGTARGPGTAWPGRPH